MRIKIIGLLGCILLLANSIQALDIFRYCCCLQIFKNRDSRASFASTESNDDYQCFEDIIDGQTVLTFIQNPTKSNRLFTENNKKQTAQNNQQSGSFHAHQHNNTNDRFAHLNSMGVYYGAKG